MLTAQPSAAALRTTPLPEGTDQAAPTPELAPTAHAAHRFTLYAWHGHVYASNVRDKLIDLGRLDQDGDTWSYALDGDACPAGSGFASAGQALAEVARCLTFLYLDGQFTAQRDQSGMPGPGLAEAPQAVVTLDPRGQAAPVIGVRD